MANTATEPRSPVSLKSFHIVFIGTAIVLMSGFGVWGLLNDYMLAGAVSVVVAVLLVLYFAYFAVADPIP